MLLKSNLLQSLCSFRWRFLSWSELKELLKLILDSNVVDCWVSCLCIWLLMPWSYLVLNRSWLGCCCCCCLLNQICNDALVWIFQSEGRRLQPTAMKYGTRDKIIVQYSLSLKHHDMTWHYWYWRMRLVPPIRQRLITYNMPQTSYVIFKRNLHDDCSEFYYYHHVEIRIPFSNIGIVTEFEIVGLILEMKIWL